MSTINEIFRKLSDTKVTSDCFEDGIMLQDLLSSDVHVFIDTLRKHRLDSLLYSYREFNAMVVPTCIRTLPEVHVLGINDSLIPEYYLSVDKRSYRVENLLSRDRENWSTVCQLNKVHKLYYVWDMASEIAYVCDILSAKRLYRDSTIKTYLGKMLDVLRQIVINAYSYAVLAEDDNQILTILPSEDFKEILHKDLLKFYSLFMYIVAEVRLYERY